MLWMLQILKRIDHLEQLITYFHICIFLALSYINITFHLPEKKKILYGSRCFSQFCLICGFVEFFLFLFFFNLNLGFYLSIWVFVCVVFCFFFFVVSSFLFVIFVLQSKNVNSGSFKKRASVSIKKYLP